MPPVLTPRSKHDFVLQHVNTDSVRTELLKLKTKKATGDDLPALLMKDAACIIEKPIAHLINLTFSTSVIPTDWKEAKATPIYKSWKKNDVNNYRRISVLPLVSKLMERAVQIQLVSFLSDNSILSTFQSGFRKRHSAETAVVHLVDHILEHMDIYFIDLKKAFDLVDHACMLHKLEHLGVRGKDLEWFRNYLTTRSQRVKYENELSFSLPLDYGVPQGSLLGSLFFVLYINDLPQCIRNSYINMYADDAVIYSTGADIMNNVEILKMT